MPQNQAFQEIHLYYTIKDQEVHQHFVESISKYSKKSLTIQTFSHKRKWESEWLRLFRVSTARLFCQFHHNFITAFYKFCHLFRAEWLVCQHCQVI